MTTQRRRVSQTKMAGRATEHSPQRDDSDVISHVSLWRRRPLLLSGQVAPFAVLWAAWAAWAGAGGGASDMRWLQMDIPEFMELFKERATAPFFVFQQLRNMAEIRRMGAKPYTVQVCTGVGRVSAGVVEVWACEGFALGLGGVRVWEGCLQVWWKCGSCGVSQSVGRVSAGVVEVWQVWQVYDPRIVTDSQDSRLLDLTTDSKLHVLYGGTKIVQHTPPIKTTTGLRGTADPERSRYKLFLECTLILTSVVPPELPIELSLAVNTSLLSLSKLCVFCTEPFRIPLAGKIDWLRRRRRKRRRRRRRRRRKKIDVTCFDKTGTLTSSDLLVEGLAGLGTSEIVPLNEAPPDSIQVVAACHSLVQLEEGLVGDPQEKATLAAIDWMLTKGDSSGAAVVPRKGKMAGLRIIQRHHFTAQLKRMAVVAGFTTLSGEVSYISAVKGAPETIREMLHTVPPGYDNTYKTLSKRGARVLALGRKELGRLAHAEVRSLTRGDLESDLTFAGFIIISCPLKRDSKEVIREILHSSHAAVILTGDNYLTACHVANELKFTQKSAILVLQAKEQAGEELSEKFKRERETVGVGKIWTARSLSPSHLRRSD
ncbi:endoplasmic reticulum transmembrane helix translocase-like [Scylla paramamosain]|uniref:endoplasmic reticulum transmembrane helix translocase-like n=1 Tax=Scylla paramamosain TaxID=85552 RepID=UPI0030839A1F